MDNKTKQFEDTLKIFEQIREEELNKFRFSIFNLDNFHDLTYEDLNKILKVAIKIYDAGQMTINQSVLEANMILTEDRIMKKKKNVKEKMKKLFS